VDFAQRFVRQAWGGLDFQCVILTGTSSRSSNTGGLRRKLRRGASSQVSARMVGGLHRALHSQPGELLELSCAVAQLLRRHAEEVEHRELQVRQRRVFWIYEMAAALESARASAD